MLAASTGRGVTERPAAILGAGNWGTALAVLLARKGVPARLWGRDAALLDAIGRTRENRRYLPGVALDARITPAADLRAAIADADAVVLAVPCAAMRELCALLRPQLAAEQVLVSAAKGLEETSGLRMSEVILQELPDTAPRLTVLSGPNLGAEVAAGVATTAVVAGGDETARCRVQALFMEPAFRVYTNTDVAGVELGGALKNVIAIAAGVCDGLGFGANTRASLMTRGLAEITRLGVALGAQSETFRGLSGLGDLIATCAGPASRNYRVGFALGRGERLEHTLRRMGQVAEGVPTTRVVCRLAQVHGIEMPISAEVLALIEERKSAREALLSLMARPARAEVDEAPVVDAAG